MMFSRAYLLISSQVEIAQYVAQKQAFSTQNRPKKRAIHEVPDARKISTFCIAANRSCASLSYSDCA